MTVGIGVLCKDGIVLACDSLATFGRGVTVSRQTNKVHIIEHPGLLHPIALIGAGGSTFVDKFIERSRRAGIDLAVEANKGEKLDVFDFAERVCEKIVSYLCREYLVDRHLLFEGPTGEYSLAMILAGATRDGELRAYNVYSMGITESVQQYGTIGSGAAYAELFLRDLIPDPSKVSIDDAACFMAYAIKGVELMDPYVGGDTNIETLQMVGGELILKPFPKSKMPKKAKEKMEKVLKKMAQETRSLVGKPKQEKKSGQARKQKNK